MTQQFTVSSVLLFVGVLIIISHLFSWFSSRTKFPSVLLLMASGFLFAKIFPSFEINQSYLELFGTLGLIMIVLEGALDLEISREKLPIIRSAAGASLLTTAISIAGLSAFFYYVFHASITSSILYSIPFSIISSAIAIPSATRLHPDKREFITYESTLSDIFGIMIFNFVIFSNISAISIFSFSVSFLIMILISATLSLLMIFMIGKMQKGTRNILTIAGLIVLYEIGKDFELSSLVLILIFGLLFNNMRHIIGVSRFGRIFNSDDHSVALNDFKSITTEAAFLVRTLFFFAFGASMNIYSIIKIETIVTGTVAVIFIYIVRYMHLKIIAKKSVMPEIFIAPRGLITILLFTTIPTQFSIVKGLDKGMLLFVILSTNLVMATALILHKVTADECDSSN
ncbi:MAG: cation:proton antiporter [Fibrobacteres bacterium]|nr:cation:proton antiporter [Fibrobacterota bacterium]